VNLSLHSLCNGYINVNISVMDVLLYSVVDYISDRLLEFSNVSINGYYIYLFVFVIARMCMQGNLMMIYELVGLGTFLYSDNYDDIS
jgi:hypothetical protein